MDDTLIIKRLDDEVIKKIEELNDAKINIKKFICDAIMNYKIENQK